jgi:hypothetical protein
MRTLQETQKEDGCGQKFIVIASVYTPSKEKERAEYLQELNIPLPSELPSLIGGDWNTTIAKEDRSTNKRTWKAPPSIDSLSPIPLQTPVNGHDNKGQQTYI